MIPFLLMVSMLLLFGSLAVLLRSITTLVAEVRRTTSTGAASLVCFESVVAGIRDEEGQLREDLALLSEAAAAWPRTAVLSRESGVLVRNIKSLRTAFALLSKLRKAVL